MIMNSARFLLFGPKLDAKVTLQAVATRKVSNLARGWFGMPPNGGPGFTDWLWHKFKEAWALLFGYQGKQLPDDLPQALFDAIDKTLRNRGGMADKETQAPNYWASEATSTPFFWSILVDYAPSADPAKVAGFEMALEDAITRAGYDYNVRIQKRPLRLEIDKPEPPTITLAEVWPQVIAHKQNERQAVVGLAFLNGVTATLFMTLEGEDFSVFVAGSPGAGKTQLTMSMILSEAMTNSPDSLTMVIIDPKAVDFRPFNALPHLALPVITEPTYAAEVIQWLCDEMDKRTRQAAKGDNSFFKHSILLYVDEMADLVMSLPDAQGKAVAANIQRLGQKGRGVGFIIIGATQRVYDIDASMHSKLNARMVGKMRTAGDSVAASGMPGTTTNKLPGRGSFELYCSDQTGLRIQAPFVAASDKPGYEAKLKPFFNDIQTRWKGDKPGWMPPQAHELPAVDTMPTLPPVVNAGATTVLDDALVNALQAEYNKNPEALSARTVRRIVKELTGKEPENARAKMIKEQFLSKYATELAGSF